MTKTKSEAGLLFIENLKAWVREEIQAEVSRQVQSQVAKTIEAFGRRALAQVKPGLAQEGVKGKQDQQDQEDLSKHAKRMYEFLREYRADKAKAEGPYATPSYADIKDGIGLTANQVSASYKELEGTGLVTRHQKGRKKVVTFPTP